jgi:uncharacterized protein (TIGR00255 family)
MTYSMTGYGNSQGKFKGLDLTIEIRSVNNRFQEISVKLPKKYQIYEYFIREYLKDKILRGKISIHIQIASVEKEENSLILNKSLLSNYVELLNQARELAGIKQELSLMDLMQLPDLITENEDLSLNEDLKEFLKELLDEAVANFNDMRFREGSALREDIVKRKNWLKEAVVYIENEASGSSKEEYEKFKLRVTHLLSDTKIDQDRLEQEIAVLSDKVDVSEETVRLNSHINLLEQELEKNEAIGKKLNFILQEMNREINTIGSKTSKTSISHKVVSCKEEVEKIREQVQNIE